MFINSQPAEGKKKKENGITLLNNELVGPQNPKNWLTGLKLCYLFKEMQSLDKAKGCYY